MNVRKGFQQERQLLASRLFVVDDERVDGHEECASPSISTLDVGPQLVGHNAYPTPRSTKRPAPTLHPPGHPEPRVGILPTLQDQGAAPSDLERTCCAS